MATKTKENTTLNVNENASKEEMDAKRAEVTAWYSESIVHLKIQLEYETILKDIETARAERIQSQMFISQAMTAGPEELDTVPATVTQKNASTGSAKSDWDASSNNAPPRKLKKETNV